MQATRMIGHGQACPFIMKTEAGNGCGNIGKRLSHPLILGTAGTSLWKTVTTKVVTTNWRLINMCRSIKPLRNMDHPVTEQEIQEAALQYVRKVSGYRKPSKANEEAFQQAINEVAETTRKMLEILVNKPSMEKDKSHV